MIKVITYGTYDLLHKGHIRLLQRAKALGDYLIVGITADDFDKGRGKINVQQSLMERIEEVRKTGLADEIIVEEYEGQKIDDIRRRNIDVFAIGSDWEGKFDYLKEFCKVIYLPRTRGISSTGIRSKERQVSLGICGNDYSYLTKYVKEGRYVNGLEISGIYTDNPSKLPVELSELSIQTSDFNRLLEYVDAVYLYTPPHEHYNQIKLALEQGKHVLVEAPLVDDEEKITELRMMASRKKLVLFDALRTAYSTAYYRLLLLAKSGLIGNILSVDATCTSLKHKHAIVRNGWNSIGEWGPTAMLPIFQLLGCKYDSKGIISSFVDEDHNFDAFTKIEFVYPNAVASLKVGKGVKSEGNLVVSGTKGYIYVPAPWWKTDYFEVRYENTTLNKRYFYQLDGEGIRYELVNFVKSIETDRKNEYISDYVSRAIVCLYSDFLRRNDMTILGK